VIRDFSTVPEIAASRTTSSAAAAHDAPSLYLAGGVPWGRLGFCLPTMTLAHATFAINTINHCSGRAGSRPSTSRATTRSPRSSPRRRVAQQPPSLSARRAQRLLLVGIRLTWYVIRAMQAVGLAWDVQPVPKRIYEEARGQKRSARRARSERHRGRSRSLERSEYNTRYGLEKRQHAKLAEHRESIEAAFFHPIRRPHERQMIRRDQRQRVRGSSIPTISTLPA
jgi:hypothetical protein